MCFASFGDHIICNTKILERPCSKFPTYEAFISNPSRSLDVILDSMRNLTNENIERKYHASSILRLNYLIFQKTYWENVFYDPGYICFEEEFEIGHGD